jgi:hypothetical protein
MNVASATIEQDATMAADQTTQSTMSAAAEAIRDAASTASNHAAKVRDAFGDAGPRALRSVSRVTYTTVYMLSYGIVYTAVLLAQSLPQENPIMHGLHDGGAAARDALRGKRN